MTTQDIKFRFKARAWEVSNTRLVVIAGTGEVIGVCKRQPNKRGVGYRYRFTPNELGISFGLSPSIKHSPKDIIEAIEFDLVMSEDDE